MQATAWATMGFDGQTLLLPQESVGSIELVQSVHSAVETDNSLGTISSGGRTWPVFALDRLFNPLSSLAEGHRFIVCLTVGDDPLFAIACETVTTLGDAKMDDFNPIRQCMRIASCPVEAVLYRDNRLMLVPSLDAMKHLLLTEMH